jgi:hypothetical protein
MEATGDCRDDEQIDERRDRSAWIACLRGIIAGSAASTFYAIIACMNADEFSALIAGLESQGMTKTVIARETGLSRMTVWRLAVGECSRPSYDTITRLKAFERRLARPVTDMLRR